MTEIANTAQAESWNGHDGRRHAAQPDRWDRVNGVFNADLFAAAGIGPEDEVLDIGCGNGQTTRLAARRTAGKAVGIDLSTAMLETARAKAVAEGLSNTRFVHGDAQVYPFPDAAFDVAISRFALTFFCAPVTAMSNIARALRPGARLASLCVGDYSKGDWLKVFTHMMANMPVPLMGEPAPSDGFTDPEGIARVLDGAGFTRVTTQEVVQVSVWGTDAEDAADFMLSYGRIHRMLEELEPGKAAEVRRAVADAFRPFERPDGVRMTTPAWLTTAVRP
ncbi:methyltransferase domain-containing protein [Actinomadura sp. 6K520]|jgi:ubiquinone/menaquinone biosynthesis C-methylase UbiE|uniref:methyltransferase domain-containing protein n=1 Tax=Actinomadura sp. 6K520 TaxID=2530364 RepID=UPI00104C7C01|nr:methyltransferase domain-containing protein [Actinomadura sp. 6K520]TDE26622.1 class I SAM-dependent methyltransferase [Actinomadura sp. 6K520]